VGPESEAADATTATVTAQETGPDHAAVLGNDAEILVGEGLSLPSQVCPRLTLRAQERARAIRDGNLASIREEHAAYGRFLATAQAGLLGARGRDLGGPPFAPPKMRNETPKGIVALVKHDRGLLNVPLLLIVVLAQE
jgi:hypothetical protein